nr:uncharacterized protein LOC111512218 [Leptinotarsa decemlineata]
MCNETTYQLINSLYLPNKPSEKPFKELIALFDKHFTPAKLVFPDRKIFYSASKNKDETVQEWAARIRQLAGKCDFKDELTVVMRDPFICGLPKGPIKDRLFEENSENLTFEKAIEIALNKEASSQRSQAVVIKSETRAEQEVYHLGGRKYAGTAGGKRLESSSHPPQQDRSNFSKTFVPTAAGSGKYIHHHASTNIVFFENVVSKVILQ